jgi:hypothetical protein
MEPRIVAVGVMNRSAIRTPWWRAAIAVSALAPVVGLLCPPAHAGSEAIIWEGNDQSVALAPQDEETAPPNDHPATLAPQDIERMLAGLRFRYADQETDTPPVAVFNAEQVGILGEALATGLSRATPSQDVTFSIIGAHRLSPGAFARRNRLTAGRVFFREGELNVIFGEIQSPYRKKNIYGQVDQDFHPREFGSRTIPSGQESILIASTAASLRGDAEGKRDDWVVFDPDNTGAIPVPHSAPMDAAAEQPEPEPTPGQSRSAPVAADSASVEISGAAPGTDDIEQRLETLKRLRDEGLVSEEAYREKVDEILEEL